MRVKTLIYPLICGLMVMIFLPAKAQIGQLWSDFSAYSIDLQNYVRNNVSQTLKPLEFRVQSALQESTGEANIPNPLLAGERVGDDIFFNSLSDKFENNSVVRSQLTQNEIDRLITLGSVSSDWGESGQIRLKRKLQNTEVSLNKINKFAQEADQIYQDSLNKIISSASQLTGINGITASLNSSQSNLQLQTIKIQTEQGKILAENLGQSFKTNQFLLYSNLNLSNIAEQIEDSNRSRRIDTAGETARLLKTVAQTDLLGRTSDPVNTSETPENTTEEP